MIKKLLCWLRNHPPDWDTYKGNTMTCWCGNTEYKVTNTSADPFIPELWGNSDD